MKGTLRRVSTGDEGTFGELSLEGGFTCMTAELPWRENTSDLSRIPVGTYVCKQRFSWRFAATLYEVNSVPKRANILIHRGNFAGDTTKGYKSDVEGCILLGESRGLITPKNYPKPQMALLNSTETLKAFMKATAKQELVLLVLDDWRIA